MTQIKEDKVALDDLQNILNETRVELAEYQSLIKKNSEIISSLESHKQRGGFRTLKFSKEKEVKGFYMSTWFAFWIFLAIFASLEAYLTTKGIDTFFWKFKTPAELVIQKNIIESSK